jgi:transmembrane sensor
MEEPVNMLGEVMAEVAADQRERLARANVIARVRARPPQISQSRKVQVFTRRLLWRFRFVVPTLAAVGGLALWWTTREAPLSFAVGGSIPANEQLQLDERLGGGRPNDRRAAAPGSVGDRLEAPSDRGLPLHFSDGSLVALDRGARVHVMSLENRGATLQIEKGRAEVSVRHRRNTRWQLRAGSFEVAVTGTRFSIDWDDRAEALTVVMAEGTVEVSGRNLGGGSPIIVTAGQRFQATGRESRWTLASSALSAAGAPSSARAVRATNLPAGPIVTPLDVTPGSPSPSSASAEAPSMGPPPTAAPLPLARAGSGTSTAMPRSWQTLARSGRYREALASVERSGFDKACRHLGAEDLVQLGDAARLARSPARAEVAYRTARRRFPAIDRPAFALGLVAFEQRRDFRAAAKWFDVYVREYPNGALAREAVGREMESWHRAGDAGRARRAARDYLSQAPTGPYAPLARQIAAP